MFRKLLKFGAAAGILGGGQYVGDLLWFGMVHPRLPDKFTNFLSMSAVRANAYRYTISAAAALVVVPLAARVLGLGAKSPLKPGTSPV